MKVNEARQKLLKAVQALERLKKNCGDRLKFREEITSILDEFTRERIANLKEVLSRRRKKRLRQARKRANAKREKEELEIKKKCRSEDADAWLRQCQEIAETAKAEESVRREADAVLHSVRKKKAEARRMLALLPAITRLRKARVQEFVGQGGQPSQQTTEAFEATTEKLRQQWEKQMEMCNVEEAALKVMLAEGSASKLGRLERETVANLQDWLLAMFGEGSIPEIAWDDLVATRTSWDRFIVSGDVPLSSAIPSGWLLPQPLKGQDWKDAVKWF